MKTIEYKSIKINNINEKNDYDGRYIKTTTTTTYDMNNIFDHKIKCNIIVIIFQHFIYFLFCLLAYSISFTLFINLFIAFLYALICGILLRVLPNFEYSYLGYWRTYLECVPKLSFLMT